MAPAHVPVVISGIEFAFTALLAALGLWNLASPKEATTVTPLSLGTGGHTGVYMWHTSCSE